MKKTITLNESELISLIERMVNEGKAKHTTKKFKEFLTYAKKHLKSNIEERNNKVKFCPIGHSDCYIAHIEDRALFDIYRFYAKVFGVSKQDIETSFNQNKPIKLNERMDKEYGGKLEEETGTSSSGAFSTALDQPIRRKIRTGLTKEEFIKLKEYMEMDESLSEGKKKTGTKLCARGKAAAKSKFKVYPSAYSSGYGVQVCKGRMPGLDGKKRCSGAYC